MPKVLIIDDDLVNTKEYELALTEEGYEVRTTSDGFYGIEMARSFLPDIILCDVVMPGIDGFEVLRQLATEPFLQSTVFVFITGQTDRESIRTGMNLGADDYLTKPFTYQELLEMVETRLAVKASRKQHQLKMLFEQLARQQGIEGTVVIQAEPEKDTLLTNRELEVLRYVASGMTNMEIADKLTISPRTVETHRSNMMQKLGASSQAELIRYAFQHGIAPLSDTET